MVDMGRIRLPGVAAKHHLTTIVLILVSVFVILNLHGIWSALYIPLQDYPSHLVRVQILVDYQDSEFGYSRYFVPNWGLAPNQLSDFLIFLLAHVFSVDTAARIFFSLYVVLFPLSSLYFLRNFSPANAHYFLVGSALTFNHFALMANENFLSSIPAFLFFLAYWHKSRTSSALASKGKVSLFAVVLYYSHMLSFACAWIIALILCQTEGRNWKSTIRALTVFTPGILLCVVWLVHMYVSGVAPESQIHNTMTPFSSFGEKGRSLILGMAPGLTNPFETPINPLYYLIVASSMIAVAIHHRRVASRGLLYGMLVLAFLCCVLPKWLVIYDPGQRIALLNLAMLPALLPDMKRLKYAVTALLAVLIFLLKIEEGRYLRSNGELLSTAVASFAGIGSRVEKGGKMLPLVLDPYNTHPALHRSFEYFSLLYGGMNPHHLMSPDFTVRYRSKPPAPDMYQPLRVTEDVVRQYDYVVVVGRGGDGGMALVRFLRSLRYVEITKDRFTGVFARDGRITPTH